MNRFLAADKITPGGNVFISDRQQLHHIKHVLRLKPGRKVAVFDGQGNEFCAVIRQVAKSEVRLEIGRQMEKPVFALKFTIACAIPKKPGMDELVDKLTQLGVYRIIPLECARSEVSLDKGKIFKRLERWKKIALSAAKQSHRNTLPLLEPPMDIKHLIGQAGDFDLKLIPTLAEGTKKIREVFSSLKSRPESILALIGPEGDFSREEVGLAQEAGFIPVSLGRTVLRVDTAALSLASFIMLNEDSQS